MVFGGLPATHTPLAMVIRLPRTVGKSGSSCSVGRHPRARGPCSFGRSPARPRIRAWSSATFGTPRCRTAVGRRHPRTSRPRHRRAGGETNDLIDEAMNAGLVADHPIPVGAKMLRLELLKTKAELERSLSELVLDCTACGMEVHWVQGVSVADPGHRGHRHPAPSGERWSSGGSGLQRIIRACQTPTRPSPPKTMLRGLRKSERSC
jgi:hypothetical protein